MYKQYERAYMAAINSVERVKDKGNTVQVKVVAPVVSIAVPAIAGVVSTLTPALNIKSVHIGNEIKKDNLAALETIYAEERKHLGEIL